MLLSIRAPGPLDGRTALRIAGQQRREDVGAQLVQCPGIPRRLFASGRRGEHAVDALPLGSRKESRQLHHALRFRTQPHRAFSPGLAMLPGQLSLGEQGVPVPTSDALELGSRQVLRLPQHHLLDPLPVLAAQSCNHTGNGLRLAVGKPAILQPCQRFGTVGGKRLRLSHKPLGRQRRQAQQRPDLRSGRPKRQLWIRPVEERQLILHQLLQPVDAPGLLGPGPGQHPFKQFQGLDELTLGQGHDILQHQGTGQHRMPGSETPCRPFPTGRPRLRLLARDG